MAASLKANSTRLLNWFSACALACCVAGCPKDNDKDTPSPPDCPAGTLNCPCNAGACNTGLVCNADRCETSNPGSGLAVSDPGARSCEVLLGGSSEHVKVQFGASVTGKAIHEEGRLALAFHANADSAIPSGAVGVAGRTGVSTDVTQLTVITSRCYDRNGAVLAGARVTLGTASN